MIRGARRLCSFGACSAALLTVATISPGVDAGRAVTSPAFSLVLRNSFVQAYRDRATMAVDFKVVGAQTTAHSVRKDGEVHLSGTATYPDGGEDVGFATVAEIMHADQYEGPGGLLRWIEAEGKAGRAIPMRGVWRIWGEHGDRGTLRQGIYPAPASWNPVTNPAHVFELHPVTSLKRDGVEISFLRDFKPLPGFLDPGDVQRTRGAFGYLQRSRCTITPGPLTTTLAGTQHRYNFLGFTAAIKAQPRSGPGGDALFARADIFDQTAAPGEAPLAKDIRLVLVPGTPPAAAARAWRAGSRVHAVGFARISLPPVAAVIRTGRPATGRIPYELIVTWLPA